MSPRPSLVAIATSLLLAACGGSAHPSGVATTSATAAASSAPRATTSSTHSATPAATTTSSAGAPPEVPKATRAKKHRGGSSAASEGVHVQTRMIVTASGSLSPPTVSLPSGVGVELRITNGGSVARTIVLGVAGRPSVRLAPGGAGTVEADGQRDGAYPILVDGSPRGQLMSGAQGGP